MYEVFVVNINSFCKNDVWLSWLERKFGCHQCKWYYSHYCRTAEVPSSPCVPCARVFFEKLTDPKWIDAQLLFVCPHSTVRCVVGVIDARVPSSDSKCLSFFPSHSCFSLPSSISSKTTLVTFRRVVVLFQFVKRTCVPPCAMPSFCIVLFRSLALLCWEC